MKITEVLTHPLSMPVDPPLWTAHERIEVAGAGFEALPAGAVEDAKRVVLDTLGAAWPAAGGAGVAQLVDYVLANGGRREATLWGYGNRVAAPTAALVNGTQAAALDFDSIHGDRPARAAAPDQETRQWR